LRLELHEFPEAFTIAACHGDGHWHVVAVHLFGPASLLERTIALDSRDQFVLLSRDSWSPVWHDN
jgi:hypothetical protein